MSAITLEPVGVVRSPLTSRHGAPRQPDEDAPPASIQVEAPFREAMAGLRPGDRIVVITWLHAADRGVQRVHPRGDAHGRRFDASLLSDLPSGVDPCGERGEFHTFVSAGPVFTTPIPVECGDVVLREGRFAYCDLRWGRLSEAPVDGPGAGCRLPT